MSSLIVLFIGVALVAVAFGIFLWFLWRVLGADALRAALSSTAGKPRQRGTLVPPSP